MGPLTGVKIIEIAGIGPGPFAGMMLSDMGAEIIRVDRKASLDGPAPTDVLARNRKSIAVNLKSPEGIETVLKLCEGADAIFEGFRPGVTERLGIGPDACLARNPKLVYGRMTGWGQDGPMAQAAGHDINYISLSGALHAIGRKGDKPVPPLNLVGDFGGGGMMLAFGMVCALLEAKTSGKGQVVDTSMVEGSAALMGMMYSMLPSGMFSDQRGTNMLDGAPHFYDTYETSDGGFISLGSIEPQFYALLIEKADLDPETFAAQHDKSKWPELKDKITEVFKTKTRDQWCEIMEGTDVCFAPVISLIEAPNHPHNKFRNSYTEIDGIVQPNPAPKFSRTKAEIRNPARRPGEDTDQVLADWGFSADEVASLKTAGALPGVK